MTDRLAKSDWIDHGLRTLAAQGANALRAGPLAVGLKVSRGSFYWHFQDIADFRRQLLKRWRELTTEGVFVEMADAPEAHRLRFLIERTFGRANRLERAVRAWAAEDAEAASAVEEIDAARVGFIADMLVATGVAPATAATRAIFLNWTYLGQAVATDRKGDGLPPAAVDDICALFES